MIYSTEASCQSADTVQDLSDENGTAMLELLLRRALSLQTTPRGGP